MIYLYTVQVPQYIVSAPLPSIKKKNEIVKKEAIEYSSYSGKSKHLPVVEID